MSTAHYEYAADEAMHDLKSLAKTIAPDSSEPVAITKALETPKGRTLYKNYTAARAAIVRGGD